MALMACRVDKVALFTSRVWMVALSMFRFSSSQEATVLRSEIFLLISSTESEGVAMAGAPMLLHIFFMNSMVSPTEPAPGILSWFSIGRSCCRVLVVSAAGAASGMSSAVRSARPG